MPRLRSITAAAAAGLVACAPAFDWREVRPDGGQVVGLFPCKADSHARSLTVAGALRRLTLYACTAGGITWGLSFVDVVDPAAVATALDELRAAAASNVGATATSPHLLAVPGATPNPRSVRQAFVGRLSDGRAVRMQVAVFTRGTLVFQATAVGVQLDEEAVETYFSALRFPA